MKRKLLVTTQEGARRQEKRGIQPRQLPTKREECDLVSA